MNFEAHMSELGPTDARAFRALAARLRGVPERVPSASLEGRVLAAVEAERARARRRSGVPGPWWVIAAAAAALVVVSVLFSGRGRASDPADSASAGVAWLAANQEPDGTWSPAKHGGAEVYRPALTALSALALAREEKGSFAPQVRRACASLASLQTADGAFGGKGRARLYNHAITTYALATLCPGQPALRPTLARALGFIRDRQSVEGGWDYEAGSGGNAAITAWQVRALACAEERGFEAAKIPLRKGLRWLRGNARDDGSVAYHRGSAARSDSLTALAAYALITAGKEFPGLPELGRHAVGTLSAAADKQETADCYRDYAQVLAFVSAGNVERADSVRHRMRKDQEVGRHDQWEAAGGLLYTTALTALASK